MKHSHIIILISLLAVFCGSGVWIWKNRPSRIVATVGDQSLTWGSMEQRARGLLEDDIAVNHLTFSKSKRSEALTYFRKQAVRIWIFKTVMQAEAAKQKIVIDEADRKNGLIDLATQLKKRNWTTDDYFLKGPMPEPVMRQEFEDGLIINKLLLKNVREKIRLTGQEISDTMLSLQNIAAKKEKPTPIDRKKVIDLLINEHYKKDLVRYYADLRAKTTITHPIFPDLFTTESPNTP